MGRETDISWCHHTFNPWRGCAHARFPDGREHPGCSHCYAEAGWGRRFGVSWGQVSAGGTREVAADSTWAQPLAWAKRAALHGVRERVFCASLADVLEEDAPPEAQARLWDLIRRTANVGRDGYPCSLSPQHIGHSEHCRLGLDWLLLTKRPERWQLVPEDVRPLVWLGTSVSDQATADEWVPRLLLAEGFALRFLSVEPLVGPVDLEPWLNPERTCERCDTHCSACPMRKAVVVDRDFDAHTGQHPVRRVDWVICGGESGHGARPMHPVWARRLRDQCQAAGVPYHFKQWGEWAVRDHRVHGDVPSEPVVRLGEHGRDTRDLANVEGAGEEVYMQRVGKKTAGRVLDGLEWNELPEMTHD